MIWNLRLDAETKALWEAQADAEGVPLSEFVRRVVGSTCGLGTAHRAVARAIEKGVLIRPDCCDECGSHCKPHGAHEDYRRPLDVRWLCSKCHTAWDRRDPKSRSADDAHVLLRLPEDLRARAHASKGRLSMNQHLVDLIERGLSSEVVLSEIRDLPGGEHVGAARGIADRALRTSERPFRSDFKKGKP